MKTFCKIQSLHLYPIKSARGTQVDQIQIDEFGPRFDREWMIVDEQGLFQTQRQTPQMAKIETAITGESLQVHVLGTTFFVPLKSTSNSKTEKVKVWKSEVEADLVFVDGLNEALSSLMNKKCRLVRHGSKSEREVVKSGRAYGVQFRFADAASFLITTTASLADLNSRLSDPVPMSRFRPNIVLENSKAWEEDKWLRIKGKDLMLDIVSGCGRCQIITQDPETGSLVSREPLLKLGEFRRNGNAIEFGMHAIQRPMTGSWGSLKVGESLEIES